MGRSNPKQKYFPLTGGLDLVTSPIKIKPGKLIAVKNYEQGILGGYTRIQGFERVDGRPLPSEASYWTLSFDAGGPAELVEGMRLIGETSGATGEVLSVILSSGSWAGSDAAGEVILYKVFGVFSDNEVIALTGADPGFDQGFSGGYS
jgi:hypothetical protein